LTAAQPGALTQTEPPAWVAEWLASREARADRKARQESAPPADPEAQARRAEASQKARLSKVTAGLAELDLWLRDLRGGGRAAAQQTPPAFGEAMGKRLVDNQAPGAARLVREMAVLPASGDGWPERLADRLGRLFLLLEAFQRLESLPAPLQAEVRTL